MLWLIYNYVLGLTDYVLGLIFNGLWVEITSEQPQNILGLTVWPQIVLVFTFTALPLAGCHPVSCHFSKNLRFLFAAGDLGEVGSHWKACIKFYKLAVIGFKMVAAGWLYTFLIYRTYLWLFSNTHCRDLLKSTLHITTFDACLKHNFALISKMNVHYIYLILYYGTVKMQWVFSFARWRRSFGNKNHLEKFVILPNRMRTKRLN